MPLLGDWDCTLFCFCFVLFREHKMEKRQENLNTPVSHSLLLLLLGLVILLYFFPIFLHCPFLFCLVFTEWPLACTGLMHVYFPKNFQFG
jgi:hypothetical protein